MAGIFANIDSDIQKLQKLKQEIENVKKSLKSINVKVDIDIAQGMEAQLKSLTTQYNTLAAKVGETEARITASANKIIDASNKIIQAQEKITQVNKEANVPSSGTSASLSTNTTETASIQAQVKAYEELKAEIGDVIGTRGQNIKRLIEEQNAIRLLNTEIKKITKSQGESSSLSSAQQRRLEQLNNSLLTHKTALAEVRQSLSANAKLDNAAATSMDALSQSLGRMRAAYRALTESERTSPFGKELLVSIQQADAKIKELDATIGNHQRNVGNYATGWNGLNMSIQQIGRELPSLAVGWNTFFLAISNNLPILADEIERARIQFEALKKSGQAATPVWKQVVSSIVSWQTALTVGITLLTLYGDKLVKWISSLGKAEKAIKDLYTAQRDLYNVTSTGIEQSSKEITKLNSLYKIATDVTKSTKERNNAVKELKRSYPEHLKNLSNESIKNGEVSKAIKEQTNQIIANAKATAAADQIARNWYKSFQAGVSKNIAYITKQRLEQELVAKEATVQQLSQMRARPESYAGLAKEIEGIKDRIKETDREIAKQENLQDSYQKSSKALEKLVTVAGLGGKYEDPDKNYNSILDQQKKIADILDKQALERKRREEDLENLVIQSRIDAMADGEAKIRAQRELDNKKEIQDLKRQREDYIRTEIEYQKKLFDAQEDLNAKKSKDYKKKTFDPSSVKVDTSSIDATIGYVSKRQINDQIRSQEEAWNEYIIKYGTFQQKKEAITRKYADAINKAANAGEAASLQKEFEEALANLDLSKLKEEINWEMIFGDLSKVSKKSLNEVKRQLETFKNSDEYKKMAVDQKKVIDEALNNIQTTIVDKGGLLGDLPEQLDALRIAQEELNKAQEEYNNALKNGTDVEKEAALKKKNNAEKNVQNAQTNVSKSADKTSQNLTILADTITQLGSTSEMSLSQIGSLASGLIDTFTEAGSKIGGIVGAAFSLLDAVDKQGFDGFIGNIFSSVFNASRSVWDTITFGAFSKITGSGESDPRLKEDIELLTTSNQDLKNALDNLAEKMDDASILDSTELYNQQKANLEQQMYNTQEMMRRSAEAYSNGFIGIGGSHSSNKKINDTMSSADWGRISKIVGTTVNSAGDFWRLTSEQMAMVSLEATDLYSKIKNAADDGYKDAAQYMDSYIGYYKELEELQNRYYEKLTSTSFDSIKDNFRSSLLEMKDNAEAFTEDFEEMMQNALLEIMMTDIYDRQLQEWYENFAKRVESGKELTTAEMDASKREYMAIVERAKAEWEKYQEMIGDTKSSSSSQESTKKGFAAASQDSIEELNGRFTALQIAGEEIKNQNQLQTMSILELRKDMLPIIANTTGIKDIASETRDLLRLSYEAIMDIRDNTNVIVKPIQQMASDIAEVKRNTNGLTKK